ncbi:hypothetical protein ABPG73_000485 [Tetrahymena malaccensis]
MEGEENYVSRRDFQENNDLNNISQYVSASQLDLFILKTDRQKKNSHFRLNSTINPKINLYEKQQENTIIESQQYLKRDSNLLKQQQKFTFEQTKASQTRESFWDFIEEDLKKVKDDFRTKKVSQTKAERRRSSSSKYLAEQEQFQNNLQKIIQTKNNEQKDIKNQLYETLDKGESMQTQEFEICQDQKEKDQKQKFNPIQKLLKKEAQLSNSFVARLGIFQRFLRNMKNLSQTFKFKTMTFEQKQRFNDLSFYQFKKKFISQIPVFNPFNFAVIGLELTALITLIISVFIQPLINSFDIQFLQEGIYKIVFQSIPVFILTTQILFKLNTGFSKESCIFNQITKNLDESWLTKNNINNSDWFVKYINSVYFSFISMVTVGYGDITPISLQEKVFVIFMVAYSCGVFGYIVSSIGNIFTERAQVQAKFKNQLADIIQYMRTRNIDQIIQSQVYKYLDYLEKMDHYNHQKGELTVQKLSPYLQKQIKINSYYPFLKKINYFKLNFKDSILVNASLQIKELTFGPSQIIFHQNDFDNRLYFILKGEVQLSVNDHKICIINEKDNCFGINEFFTGEARNLQAQSLTVSQILYLELNDFKEILKEDPLEYEKFSSLKDQAIFSKVSIDQSCFFCNKFSHMHDQCPFYTLKNQKLLIIERSKRSTDQLRQKIERVNLQKYNSLLQNQITKVNLKAIRLNYINNLAVDKHEIIQLVQNNIYDEDDIDFYRNYDAFEYIKHLEDERDEVTEFKQNIKLISSDQIADQFLSYEDITEKQQEEILESNIFVNSVNKFATSSIQAIENYTEEQKYVQILPFISSHNHQTKRNSIHKNFIQQQNVNAKERLSLIKEHNSLINIQNNQDQIQMKGPDSSTYLNENTKKNNNLLNQAHNLFELKKEKPNSDQGLDGKYIINQDGFFTINKFDQMQLYTRYFPKNNFNQVLQKYNKLSNKTQRIAFKKAKKQIIRKKNVSQNMYDFKQNNIKKAFLKCQTINSLQKKVFLEKQVKQLTINLDSNPKLGVQALMQDNQNDQKIQYQQQHNKQTDAEKSVFSNLNI